MPASDDGMERVLGYESTGGPSVKDCPVIDLRTTVRITQSISQRDHHFPILCYTLDQSDLVAFNVSILSLRPFENDPTTVVWKSIAPRETYSLVTAETLLPPNSGANSPSSETPALRFRQGFTITISTHDMVRKWSTALVVLDSCSSYSNTRSGAMQFESCP